MLEIPLGDGFFAYGRTLIGAFSAFYDIHTTERPPLEAIVSADVLFTILFNGRAVIDGTWEVIGYQPLDVDPKSLPVLYKRDILNGELSLYYPNSTETPATENDIEGLELAAVWSGGHIGDRLRDHYAGRPCLWLATRQPGFVPLDQRQRPHEFEHYMDRWDDDDTESLGTETDLPGDSGLIVARLKGSIRPSERADQFEDPLNERLQAAGIGEVTGGGTEQDASGKILFSDIEIVVATIDESTIKTLTTVLEELGAPDGSYLVVGDDAREIKFGKLE